MGADSGSIRPRNGPPNIVLIMADVSEKNPEKVKHLATLWAEYAERSDVVDWDTLDRYHGKPRGNYWKK